MAGVERPHLEATRKPDKSRGAEMATRASEPIGGPNQVGARPQSCTVR